MSLGALAGALLLFAACGQNGDSSSTEPGANVDPSALKHDKTPSPSPAPPPSAEPVPPPADDGGTPVPSDPLAVLPTCSTSVLDAFRVSAIQPIAANSDAYRAPTANRMQILAQSIQSLVQGDAAGALNSAISAEYGLCRGSGDEASIVLWRPPSGSGDAVFALRTGPARPAIFEAPHPVFDSGTPDEAAYLFDVLNARALLVSGTHRCANAAYSACSGTTAACGTNEPFRESDMAHNEGSLYHAAHRALSDAFPTDWVFGVHGMSAGGISVSNGSTQPAAKDSPSAKVASALAERISGVTTCNDFGGSVAVATQVCGTTDAQGRYLNGSPNACTQMAPAASGRFIHMEQSKTVRSAPADVAAALDLVIPR